jgi:hypothetical protein
MKSPDKEQFRTVIKCEKSIEKICYDTHLLMLGSCFTENLGMKLKTLKFNITINPFGIVYHPLAVSEQINRIIMGKIYSANELIFDGELWHSFEHHGRFSHCDSSEVLQKINSELLNANIALQQSKWLFITFGTAWGYTLKDEGRIVANCHKFPASKFERIRFNVNDITENWIETITKLQKFNPELKIVFTLSPIRHLRDGAYENQLSKATLLLAIEEIMNKTERTSYFPAYEIVLDDLRDYRFYKEDMVHPNNVAIEYIWQKFCDTFFADNTLGIISEVEDIVKAASHRPLHKTLAIKKFASAYLEKIAALKSKNFSLDFSAEKQWFNEISV